MSVPGDTQLDSRTLREIVATGHVEREIDILNIMDPDEQDRMRQEAAEALDFPLSTLLTVEHFQEIGRCSDPDSGLGEEVDRRLAKLEEARRPKGGGPEDGG